jgi:alkylation response protein AidB-like acyl-CoA dehydrogenase
VTADSSAVLNLAREFAAEVLQPMAAEVESSGQIPAAHFDQLAALGLYGMAGPRATGGLDLDFVTACRVIEILASGCLSTAFVWLQHHGAVRAVASSADQGLRERWLRPLCLGERRAGLALAGGMPGPALLRARPVRDGYVFDGVSPWVTGWGHIDTLHAAARDADDNVVWAILDTNRDPELSVSPLDLVAVMASQTVRANFQNCFVPAERVTQVMPLRDWQVRDAAGLRTNGSLALGVTARCCALAGPSSLDAELTAARDALDAGTPQTMPAARAVASELAMRAATALVVSDGSRSILAGADAQRLVREAMFLLVFASRPTIKHHLRDLLVANPHSRGGGQ